MGVHRILQCRGSRGRVARGSEDGSPLGGSRGKVPQGPERRSTQKLKNVKLVYNFKLFPVENVGFNECSSRAWTVYFANTQLKTL